MGYQLSRLTLLRGLRKDFQYKKRQCLEQIQSLKGKHYFLCPTTATATATAATTEKENRTRSCAGIEIMAVQWVGVHRITHMITFE
jgi:hypothetical protein